MYLPNLMSISRMSNACELLKPWPGRFRGIAGNAGNHGNDEKFHESHKTLNQI